MYRDDTLEGRNFNRRSEGIKTGNGNRKNEEKNIRVKLIQRKKKRKKKSTKLFQNIN